MTPDAVGVIGGEAWADFEFWIPKIIGTTMDPSGSGNKKATDHLANERTFLAWMRTCISVISLGFVVSKFGVWLRELASRLTPQAPMPNMGISLPIGVGMMAAGAFFAILAAVHYHWMAKAIERGEVRSSPALISTMTAFVVLLAVLMMYYMLTTAQRL